jgi:dTDP-4-amino-4,6-dideoxy-D-galactose acyltransferase
MKPMRETPLDVASGVLRPLAWDSDHFGFPVAQITEPCLPQALLENALLAARRRGVHLVYWPAHPQQTQPAALLRHFGGLLVDQKVTYQATLAGPVADGSSSLARELMVGEYPKGRATSALVDLAVAAGAYSRFRVDPRLPTATYVSLYEMWMQRSTSHELADTVLVALRRDNPEVLVGMVTVSAKGHIGHIGLIAVAPAVRGHGVGLKLLEAAHAWMLGHDAAQARVVTQLANRPACRLYERAGYRAVDVKHVYHFWIAAAGAGDAAAA